jgi:anti-sigma-K factor RskA
VAAVAALGFAAGVPRAPLPGEAPARLISALASVDSDVALLAMLEPEAAVLSINRTSGAAAPGRALELWVIEGSNPPISLGVLPDVPQARVPLPRELAARLGPGTTLAVSSEPPGGSPTGAPTGPVVAAGPVSDI